MKQVWQTTVKDVEESEIGIIFDNLRKYGWSAEHIDQLRTSGKTIREGKLTDGCMLTETIEIKDKFRIVGV